ncbi:MAG TPA: hypothetical protein DCM23_01270 [Firmicutes bacterium]|jgi:DNA replication and repair protein RecF|nr:hypothetical protein [Bacillota bacterium]
MIVTHLELTDFRSYHRLQLDFDSGLNVLVGQNGIGKTNVVEAINYLSLARSFRTANDALLVRRGSELGVIKATIAQSASIRRITIALSGNGKKILINDKPVTRLSELSNVANVLVFEPRDVIIFDDLPKARRKFLDIALIKHSSEYLDAISRYERLLKERNEILKQERVNLMQLEVVTEQLINASQPIVIWRAKYLTNVNSVINKVLKAIKGSEHHAKIEYLPFTSVGPDFLIKAKELYDRTKEGDLKRKVTSVGPHRDDFRLDLNESDIAAFGSQGENRLLAIALKLSPYFLIEEKEKRPIVVLDDVLSELDNDTQDKLILFLMKLDQTFITTTTYKRQSGTIYDVGPQGIQRRLGYGN